MKRHKPKKEPVPKVHTKINDNSGFKSNEIKQSPDRVLPQVIERNDICDGMIDEL